MVSMVALVCSLAGCHDVARSVPTPAGCEAAIERLGPGASGTCRWSTGWSTVERQTGSFRWHIVRSDGSGNTDD